jgi:hypothetical protein
MSINMAGLIFICIGLFTALMTTRAMQSAEDWYYAMDWKVNMKVFKVCWLVGALALVIFGILLIIK